MLVKSDLKLIKEVVFDVVKESEERITTNILEKVGIIIGESEERMMAKIEKSENMIITTVKETLDFEFKEMHKDISGKAGIYEMKVWCDERFTRLVD